MPYRPNQNTPWLTPDQVRSFLRRMGMSDWRAINNVLSGYDFDRQPLYMRHFEEGEALFQYLRNAAYDMPAPRTGNWFCLRGASMDDVAITGGGSGRRRHRFQVLQAFTTIEGVARPQAVNWLWAGGGPGGGTQVFVPPRLLGHIGSPGPDE